MKTALKTEIAAVILDYERRSQAGDISPNTLKAVKNAYEHLTAYWGDKFPKDVTIEEWAKFQDHFETQNPTASHFNTRKQMTVLIKHLFDKGLIKKKVQIKDRFARREKNQRRKKKGWVYTPEEIQALDKACKTIEERIQIRLGYLMGFRISDMVQLTWERIILDGKHPYVEFSGSDDKAGKIARCPMPPSILQLLMQIPKTSKWCFPQKRNPDRHIRTQQINFEDLKRRAGVTRGSPHSLRHYCLSRDFSNKNLTPAQICSMRRVSMQVAMEHYYHTSDDDMGLMIKESK